MDNADKKLLSDLREKIEILILLNEKSKEEYEASRSEIEKLNQLIINKDLEYEQLLSKYNNLKMVKDVTGDASVDRKMAKKKIKNIIKEIDKSIALLNK